MVLHAMLRKRVLRGQEYIAYGLLHHLHETCRDVIRTALVPHSRHHGWYHLPDEVGRTAIGRECLAELTDALCGPPVPTVVQADQADQALERIVRLSGRIAPWRCQERPDRAVREARRRRRPVRQRPPHTA